MRPVRAFGEKSAPVFDGLRCEGAGEFSFQTLAVLHPVAVVGKTLIGDQFTPSDDLGQRRHIASLPTATTKYPSLAGNA